MGKIMESERWRPSGNSRRPRLFESAPTPGTPTPFAAFDVESIDLLSRRVEVVIVCYHSASLVQDLLSAWSTSLKICVADNGNDVDGLAAIVGQHPTARYLPLEGVGFARAANAAVQSSNADIIVVANPDCRSSLDDVLRLAAGLADDPGAICHGAVEEISPGRYYCGGWKPTFARCLVHALALHRFVPDRGIIAVVDDVHNPPQVDWLSGTVAAFWRHHLLAAGGFDERFYVYTEDMALGNVAIELGLRQVVRGDVVVHPDPLGSGSPNLTMGGLQGASLAHYFAYYHSRIDGPACRIVLAAGFFVRTLVALLQGNRQLASRQWLFVRGISTGRAYVDGREVSGHRVRELGTTRNDRRKDLGSSMQERRCEE